MNANIEKFLATSAWYFRIQNLNPAPDVLDDLANIHLICTDSELESQLPENEFKLAG